MRTIEISGRTYAVGLWWQPSPGGPAKKGAMLKLARETAVDPDFASEDYNYVALRPEQYGLGHHGHALPSKTISLAAALRPLGQEEAFLGVFCLEDSVWWVSCIIRGLVAADGDAVFKTRDEALAAASGLRRLLGEVRLVEELRESPEAGQAFLTPLLRPEAPIRPLHEAGEQERLMRRGLLAVVLGLVFSLGVYWLYGAHQARQEAHQSAREMAAQEAQKMELLAHPERLFKKHWLDGPDFIRAGKQCAEALLSLPLSMNVWMLEEAVCRPGSSLQVSWGHRKGASFVVPPPKTGLTTPQQAMEYQTLAWLPPRSLSEDDLLTKEEVTAVLYELTQNISSLLSLSWDPPEPYRIDDETTIYAPWARGKFELSRLPARALLGADLFGALSHPGSVLVSVTQKNNDLSIKGDIYVSSK